MAECNFISPPIPKENIQGAHRGIGHISHDMGIDHGGLDILMTQKLLHFSDVDPVHEEMGGKTVAQGMDGGMLDDPRLFKRQPVIVKELLKLRQYLFQTLMRHNHHTLRYTFLVFIITKIEDHGIKKKENYAFSSCISPNNSCSIEKKVYRILIVGQPLSIYSADFKTIFGGQR